MRKGIAGRLDAAASSYWKREYWSSRWVFVLAATGSAVGLGNIWKFPYITGEYGGGAFVLVYLFCIALIGLPVMMAEILVGRRGGQSPIGSMRVLSRQENKSSIWQIAGWSGVIGSFLILSFYSVIAGWALVYIWYAISGQFSAAAADPQAAAASIEGIFNGLLASPVSLIAWHTVFMVLTIAIVAQGVKSGLEKGVTILMPGLFIILLILVGYAAFATDGFARGLAFLFSADFSKLTWEAVLVALGHAFFSLSLGMGIMVAYGSYLPKSISIPSASVIVCILDTTVALLAGMAIFPIVFAFNLEPGAGPGLIFVTLPIAFGAMPAGGAIVGTLFFIFVVFAALTSSISLLEPTVEYAEGRFGGISRRTAAIAAGFVVWLLGVGSALAFNLWSEITIFGKNIFDALDFLTANIMLPLTALLIALFVGWAMAARSTEEELKLGNSHKIWHAVVRYVSPICILIVFLYNLL